MYSFIVGYAESLGLHQYLSCKESACDSEATGDTGSIPGSGSSSGGGHGSPLQYSCLDNPTGQMSLVGYSLQITKGWT